MIRPVRFSEFMGQPQAVNQLMVPVKAALQLKRPLGHVLLSGPPGLGKTTLGGHVLPTELVVQDRAVTVNCAAIEQPQDLLPTVVRMQEGGVLFLDEIHRLPKPLTEQLYSVMEDFRLTVIAGDDHNRTTMTVELPHFTVIGATTREGLLLEPLRDRFRHSVKLALYGDDDMAKVLDWTAQQRQALLACDPYIKYKLIRACHGTARLAVTLVEACIDTCVVDAGPTPPFDINDQHVNETLDRLGFSRNGLTRAELALLQRLKDAPAQTIGLNGLSKMLDEEQDTVEFVYEPWLLQSGFVAITSKGRTLTRAGETAIQEAADAKS